MKRCCRESFFVHPTDAYPSTALDSGLTLRNVSVLWITLAYLPSAGHRPVIYDRVI